MKYFRIILKKLQLANLIIKYEDSLIDFESPEYFKVSNIINDILDLEDKKQ